jgi:hypothetical protein
MAFRIYAASAWSFRLSEVGRAALRLEIALPAADRAPVAYSHGRQRWMRLQRAAFRAPGA